MDKDLIKKMLAVPVPIHSVEVTKVAAAVYNAIVMVYTLSGLHKDMASPAFAQEAKNIAQILANDIRNTMKWLRVEEIPYCFKLGVQGELGEYYGLNYRTYFNWIKSYYHSRERRETNQLVMNEIEHQRKLKQLAQRCEPTLAEKERIIKQGINNAYVAYLKSREKGMQAAVGRQVGVVDLGGVMNQYLIRKRMKEINDTLLQFFEQCANYGRVTIFAL